MFRGNLQMAHYRTKRRSNTRSSGLLRKIMYSAFAIAIVGLLGIFIAYVPHSSNRTVMEITATQPTIQSFTTDTPVLFSSSADLPTVNNNRTLTDISPVTISYQWIDGPYLSPFSPLATPKNINTMIKVSPQIHGNWTFTSSDRIKFTPTTPWPSGTKFNITIPRDLINSDVHTRDSVSFTTPDIIATLTSFNTYPTPNNPKTVTGVAVVSFNYPIDTTHFSDKVSVKLDDTRLDFTVKFDRFNRTAVITTTPVSITDAPQIMRIKLNRVPAQDGNSATKKITGNTTIDASDSYFRIGSLHTVIADDNDGNLRQLLLINTTAPISSASQWTDHVNVFLLPQNLPDQDTDTPHQWQLDEITPDVLSSAQRIKISPADFASPMGINLYAFSYNVPTLTQRFLYVDITPGLESVGGFAMRGGLPYVIQTPTPRASIEIAGSGALLSLSGEQKLGLVARGGVESAHVNLYKVKSSEINHLISQTYNLFDKNLEFKSWSFDEYDLSTVFQKRIALNPESITQTNYASVDLGDYLDRTSNDKTGIFIVQVGTSQFNADISDKRLIVLTNLGIIHKQNQDFSSTIFISNVSDGTPASDVEISVLGRNGNAIWAGRTDAQGHAEIPDFDVSEYINARAPVAIVARRDNDVSFIPYNSPSQRVDYSQFDTGGHYNYNDTPMNAFLFSDRGIYRPGEEIIIGGIVKNKSFKSLSGVPVRLTIEDSYGHAIAEHNFALSSDGMFDFAHTLPTNSSVGTYFVRLYSLSVRSKPQDMLGYTQLSVQEFTPDTLKIDTSIAPTAQSGGWISADNITATINLRNLFGTPAQNHMVRATAQLIPTNFTFTEYPNHIFTTNFISGTGLSDNGDITGKTQTYSTTDMDTDANGSATFDVTFPSATPTDTYLLTLNAFGYESGTGKMVQSTTTTRVSNAQYLIGYKADTNLAFINRDSKHSINLVAVDHNASPTMADNLTARLVHRQNLTSLVKSYDNYYKYQTTTRDVTVSTTDLKIPETGLDYALDTTNPGTYFLEITDNQDRILAHIEYFIAGDKNTSLTTDTNAELEIKLNSDKYAPGQDIEISITAPYTGSGLITIERDRVYAYKWFHTKSTTSVQKITLPSDFQGTGYINVSFVRSTSSRDIFTTPYTYAVSPFQTDTSSRTISVKLDTPTKITGDDLTVEYTTNQDAKLMIFAVNEGILRVARYQIPNPLSYFFQKSALSVTTYQILSLLLPEYKILREFAKTGGGDWYDESAELSSPLTNPFARRNSKPVAFYSGILDAHAQETGHFTFNIPDDFNGNIKIYAVASNDSAMGATNTETLVQRPLSMTLSAPTFVAPGDKFAINATATNLTDAQSATVTATVATTDGIQITSPEIQTADITQNSEHLFTFTATADTPSATDITVTTSAPGIQTTMTAPVSVRPITTYTTNIRADILDSTHTTVRKFHVDMFPMFASRKIYISNNAFALSTPLFNYLEKYDFPCTEQLVSRTLPYILQPDNSVWETTYEKSSTQIAQTIATLQTRQNSDGSFALWDTRTPDYSDGFSSRTADLTAYVVQMLLLARENGFNVPDSMLARGTDFLRTFLSSTIDTPEMARSASFATYVVTMSGYVTTAYIDKIQDYADQNIKNWESTLMGAYIATSYHLMHQDDFANDLIAKYNTSKSNTADNAIYMFLTSKYFDIASQPDKSTLKYLNDGNYDSYTSAMIVLGLNAKLGEFSAPDITITSDDGTAIETSTTDNMLIAQIPDNVTKLNITCATCDKSPVFYSLSQQGYPTTPSYKSNGIEITRQYLDSNGEEISSAKLGDTITVKIIVRGSNNIPNVAIVDLLPGGFVASDTSSNANYSEIRSDRVVFYADLTREYTTLTYSAQVTTSGQFQVPPSHAQSMYNPSIYGNGRPTHHTFIVHQPNAN